MSQVAGFLYGALVAQTDDELLSIAHDVEALLDDFPAPFLAPLAPTIS